MADKVNTKKQVRKPKAILMDVAGTLTQGTFIPTLLVPYFKKNHQKYLEVNIEQPTCREIIDKLRTAAELDKGSPKIIQNDSEKASLIESVSTYVDHCLDNNKENKPLILYRFMVWFDGYDRDLLSTPVYADVAIQVKKWRLNMGIKLYVLSNGWSVATKKFLEKTSQGNLAALIQDYFDTDLGPLQNAATYRQVQEKLNEASGELVFLTKNVDEAKAAREVGIAPILVLTHKKDVEAASEVSPEIPHVRTFNEIEFVSQ